MNTIDEQEALFEKIYDRYTRHYDDATSRKYRDRFIQGPMVAGIALFGKKALEAMCGSGLGGDFLISRGARVTGLDLSRPMINRFKARLPACSALRASMQRSGLKDSSFDIVIVQGGLHHVQPDVESTIGEIFRILKPGGYFCFSEPHAGSLPDILRKIWYKKDPLFGKNEQAVDCDRLQSVFKNRFEFLGARYAGGPAYLFVYNSMIFRIPPALKPLYAPVLMAMDAWIEKFQGKRLSCFVICQWRKKG
jgi:ubiquinone/menaquinone biosynthesis C-methylase UbiE